MTHHVSQNGLVPQRQDTSLEYVQKHFEIGTQKNLSRRGGHQLGYDCTMSAPFYDPRPGESDIQDIPSCMLESLLQNKKEIWNVRSSFSQRNSPDIKLYETSVQELIGEDQGLEPFFDTVLKDRYEKSWLLTETGYQDWDSNLSNFSLKKQAENSWFWIREYTEKKNSRERQNSERISYPSYTFSRLGTTGLENTRNPETHPPRKRQRKSVTLKEEGKVIRARRIRLILTSCQQDRIRDCIGIHRHIYNECVNSDRNGLIHGSSAIESGRWRTILTKKTNYMVQKPWKDKCPCHTKQQAVEEYFKAKKTASKLVATGKLKMFRINFKSRFKSIQETIPFERYMFKNYTKRRSTITIPSIGTIRTHGKVPKEFSGRMDDKSVRKEIKITRTRMGVYYATILYEVVQKDKYTTCKGDMISFDPGCKTFLSYHTNDGTWGEIGEFSKQEALLKKADKMRSELDTSRKDSRYKRHLHRRLLRVYDKVRNRTADLHNKVCSWVVSKYRIILLPIFKSSEMVSSLSSRTSRCMMTWSHYSFQRKLLSLAQKFTDVKVRLVNEAYTTRQCGECGVINRKMTLSDRIFWCESCGLRAPRDGHASRNVGLRAMNYILE